MAATSERRLEPGIEPVGATWAHGFLPAEDLWEEADTEPDIRDLAPDARRLHGPCDACGFRFYTVSTAPRPRCPNCGHRAVQGD